MPAKFKVGDKVKYKTSSSLIGEIIRINPHLEDLQFEAAHKYSNNDVIYEVLILSGAKVGDVLWWPSTSVELVLNGLEKAIEYAEDF